MGITTINEIKKIRINLKVFFIKNHQYDIA